MEKGIIACGAQIWGLTSFGETGLPCLLHAIVDVSGLRLDLSVLA